MKSTNRFSLLLLATLAFTATSALAFPIITNVVETGGDNEATDTIPAKWTGVTWNATVANEPVPGITIGTPYTAPVLGEDVPCYVDRNHQWNGTGNNLPIPGYLLGGEYVLIGNDNRDNTPFQEDFYLAERSVVFVLIDNRCGDNTPSGGQGADVPGNPPFGGIPLDQWGGMQWVYQNGFQPLLTGYNRDGDATKPDEIAYDEGADGVGPGVGLNEYASIYYKIVDPGAPGSPAASTGEQNNSLVGGAKNMYGVVVTAAAAPRPPANVRAASMNDRVILTWTASSGDTSYIVRRGDASGGPYADVGTTTTTNFIDATVVNGLTYYYVVAAVGVFGTSGNSTQVIGSPKLASIQTLESTALRLEVDASPFSYRVIDKSTLTLLLSQTTNTFSFSNAAYGVSVATNFLATATTLEAELWLSGTSAVARVNFNFTQPEILQVTFISTNDASRILQQFNDQGENVYGVWEYPFGGRLDIRGTDQPFLGVGAAANINYCSARAPFYLTSRKYGIYVESDAEGRFTVAVNNRTGFSFNAPQLKFHVIYGPACSNILARYNAIAGGSYLPPTWAFSTLWWKDDDHLDFHTGVTNAQSNVLDTANQLRSCRIPASALWIDRPYGTGEKGWGNFDFDSSFPNPSQMVSNLNAMGMNLMLWIANRCWNPSYLYTNGLASGYLFSSSYSTAVDLRIPDAYTWFRSNLNAFVNLGIKGYKIDRGEEGEQPSSVQNRNSTLFHKLAFEGQSALHSNDTLVFARNVCDTGRKYSAVWNGDTTSTFAGLQYSIISGLRSGLINFPMWGSDTGGYYSGTPTEELFARWFEFSAYSPMMEILIGNSRTPWYNYSTNLVAIARKQATDHHDLLPYSRSYLYQATQTGLPLMRPLFLAYPGDTSVTNTWDEYLYGEKLLVAPVVTAGATNRSVYLPAGNWINYNTRLATYAGPTNLNVPAPLDTIPLFVNEGAIIPRGDILRANNNWTTNWSPQLRIEFFPSDHFNSSFDYYTGSSVQTITCSNQNHTLTIQFSDLGLNGNLEIYLGAFGGVSRNGTNLTPGIDYSYDAAQRLLRVPCNGATALTVAAARSLFFTPIVTLSNLFQTYDGTAKSVSVTTDPSGLPVIVTYDGSVHAPTNVGSYTVIATVNDPAYEGGTTNTLVIGCPAITLSPATLPDGALGVGYTQTVTAIGGVTPYAFAVTSGSLPNGLVLATNGAFAGLPLALCTNTFTVTATDANGCTGSNACTLAIAPSVPTGQPTIRIAKLPGGQFELTWPFGSLLESTNVLGPWNLNPAMSPYTNTPSGDKFFRVRAP